MSPRLDQAIRKLEQLPEHDQDSIAALILQELESERRWDELFARPQSADLLTWLADEARSGCATALEITLKSDGHCG